jgi:hypothetical protein
MDHLAVTVRAPFEDTPRSISAPSCTVSGINSTPNQGAADWMAANWRIPAGEAASRDRDVQIRNHEPITSASDV